MRTEEFGIVTFESTHHAIKGESIFKEFKITSKTIPTPRDITLSCGLSIKFNLSDLDRVVELVEGDNLAIKGVYKFTKDGIANTIEKVI